MKFEVNKKKKTNFLENAYLVTPTRTHPQNPTFFFSRFHGRTCVHIALQT